jgi:hypothetical protein
MLASVIRPILRLLPALWLASAAQGQVSTRGDAVAGLLNGWFGEGRAAGLAALTYENRDGGHSPLDTAAYPQLQVFQHGPDTGPPTGPALQVRARPTLGNCSMAAPADQGGSLPRHYLSDPAGARFLAGQYLSNNLFLYPEHQDHDPGANGVGGYGDLLPANSPCLLVSQGSSLSDQPFLHALLSAAAALPPETQRRLIESRLLMPTLQALLRQSLVRTPAEYFAAAAHPPVFDSARLDVERLARLAQATTPERIPPLVQLEVREETESRPGLHFFEETKAASRRLADTPVAIARVLHAAQPEFVMELSAVKSGDLLRRPLQLRWQVLQGDPSRVRIDTTPGSGTARLRVRWQPPVTSAAGLRSHRVDVAVFAGNGVSVSAPALISFYLPPHEFRFEDAEGRVSEVHHQTHNPDLGLPAEPGDPRWRQALFALVLAGDGLRSRLLAPLVMEAERTALQEIWRRLEARQQEVKALEGDPARKSLAEQARRQLTDDTARALQESLPGGRRVRQRVEEVFAALADFSDLYPSFQAELEALAERSPKASAAVDVRAEVARLVALGLLRRTDSGAVLTVSPVDALSAAERHGLRGLNLTLLSQVLFPEVLERSPAPAWTDVRLSRSKPWRDVHRYDATGRHLGWLRHHDGRQTAFDAEGRLLPEGWEQPEKTVPVVYRLDAEGRMTWAPAP